MYLLLGIIIGLLLAIIVLIVALRYQLPIQRFVNQQQSKMAPKGSIIELDTQQIDNWVSTLPNEYTQTEV